MSGDDQETWERGNFLLTLGKLQNCQWVSSIPYKLFGEQKSKETKGTYLLAPKKITSGASHPCQVPPLLAIDTIMSCFQSTQILPQLTGIDVLLIATTMLGVLLATYDSGLVAHVSTCFHDTIKYQTPLEY